MTRFEPHRSWLPLEARAEREPSQRRKALLTAVRDHMEFEIKGQIEPLMGTLTEQPVYHFWGEQPSVIEGYRAVRAFYENMIAAGSNQFEVVVDRIVVDDLAVVTEGQVKQVHRGSTLSAMGVGEIGGDAVQGDDLILTTTQLVTVWPADPALKLVGEDIYFGHGPFMKAEKISVADLPSYYQLADRRPG
jgi:hypothetical protein